MFRKSFSYLIIAVAVLCSAQIAAYAQFAPVSGTVVVKKDGKNVPVADALIQVYRTDIKGSFPDAKTNKKGEFNFVGMPYGARYAFSVSAPNCSPIVYPDIKAGMERLVITMNPGDGRKFTEAEARQAAANAATPGSAESGGMTDEQKKQQADFEKKNAEITDKNEKVKSADATALKANAEGQAALDAKNYDLAIAKFSEGIAAVPDFVGSTPILINKKMVALQNRGFKLYQEGAALTDAAARKAKYQEANDAYDTALAGFQDALGIISRAETATDPGELKRRDTLKHDLYAVAAEIHRLKVAGGVDISKANEAATIIADYLALENNPDVKLKTQMGLGDMMTRAGDFDKAVAAYRQLLVMKADHAEAMGKLGLALFAIGTANEDKDVQQEGLNFMQKYIDLSPVSPTDPPAVKELKVSIKESVDYLKAQKMTPQKTPAAGGKKK